MPTFNNLASLSKYLQKQIGEVLKNEVAEDTSDKLKKRYQDEVYSYDYNASGRSRRMSLVDDKNIEKQTVGDNTISIRSTAKPDESVFGTTITNEEGLLAQWIEDGDIPNVFDDKTDYPWTKPRPVIQNTREEIERSGSHVGAMKNGLKRRGIDLK